MVASLAWILLVGCAQAPSRRSDGPIPSWGVQAVAGSASLRGVCAPEHGVVWASGSGGTVLRSIDGGASWARVAPSAAEGLDFRSLVAFDAQRALLATAGSPARVYRTVDGGSSWNVVLEDLRPQAFFDAMAFADDARGYLVGDPVDGKSQWFDTEDGGATWRAVPAPFLPTPIEGEAMFAASCSTLLAHGDDAFLVTGGAACRFLVSTSRARGFSHVALPLLHGEPSQGAFSIARCGDRRFVVVGGDYLAPSRTDGSACWSDDGGATWQNSAGEPGYRSSVVSLGGGAVCVATGPGGTSLSRDGGRSWSPMSEVGFHALAACGDSLYGVGSDGRIGVACFPASSTDVAIPIRSRPAAEEVP